MKSKYLITIVGILAVPCLLLAQNGLTSKAKAEVSETNFNYGYVHAGGVVSHSYMFKSGGSDSLRILKVQPACGCTKAPLKKDVIASGDSSDVELVFTLNSAIRGQVSKTATVYTNDTTRSSVQLQFVANSYASPDSVTPLTLSAGEIKFDGTGKAKEAKLLLTNVSTAPAKLQLICSSPTFFKADVPESAIAPGKSKEIKVKLADKLAVDEFRQSFTFQVDDQAGTRYTIPVELAKPGQASTIQPVSGH